MCSIVRINFITITNPTAPLGVPEEPAECTDALSGDSPIKNPTCFLWADFGDTGDSPTDWDSPKTEGESEDLGGDFPPLCRIGEGWMMRTSGIAAIWKDESVFIYETIMYSCI